MQASYTSHEKKGALPVAASVTNVNGSAARFAFALQDMICDTVKPLDGMHKRLDGVDERLEKLEHGADVSEWAITGVQQQTQSMNQKVDRLMSGHGSGSPTARAAPGK